MAERKKLTSMEIAYEKILQKIFTEQLAPGMPLREDHLAKEFNVSTTPIREAFRRLEYEGWLQSIPYRGVFLRKFQHQDIEELYRIREVLEGMVAAEAARNCTHDELVSIAAAIDAEQKYYDETLKHHENDDITPAFYQDLDFHACIAKACHNKLLQQRMAMLKAQISVSLMFVKKQSFTLQKLRQVCEEHRMIYIAIQRSWADIAEMLMRRHISEAREKYAILSNKSSGK